MSIPFLNAGIWSTTRPDPRKKMKFFCSIATRFSTELETLLGQHRVVRKRQHIHDRLLQRIIPGGLVPLPADDPPAVEDVDRRPAPDVPAGDGRPLLAAVP